MNANFEIFVELLRKRHTLNPGVAGVLELADKWKAKPEDGKNETECCLKLWIQ